MVNADLNNTISTSFDPIIERVMAERDQSHETRKTIIAKIEDIIDRPLVTYFTSQNYPVMLEDSDVDMLEGFLQMMDLSKGLALMISSLGGDGLAAERMIRVCRSYSGTGEYWAIVPSKAKSAATMVCFGSSEIHMGPTAELGPVDPQVPINDNGMWRFIPAYHIVETYKRLFEDAVNQTSGNLEPYLQQLNRYDSGIITDYEAAIELAKDISVTALKTGMMNNETEASIEKKLHVFLTPKSTKTHGRPIYQDMAKNCGLCINEISASSDLWRLVYELYIRTQQYVSGHGDAVKAVESREHAVYVPKPRRDVP